MPRVQPVPVDQLTPRARAMLEEGMRVGAYNDNSGQIPPSMRTLAWSTHTLEVAHASTMAGWGKGLLEPRLQELIRIRSAQVNGCANCASAIKDDGVASDDVVCMIEMDYSKFSPREAAALRYVVKFGGDHHTIEDDDIRALLAEFSPAEVVELVHYTAHMLGLHRMFSVFKVISDCEPVIRFDPALVDAPTAPGSARQVLSAGVLGRRRSKNYVTRRISGGPAMVEPACLCSRSSASTIEAARSCETRREKRTWPTCARNP